MTRFARAKGSKASNERTPEEATSWSEMKQQLLEKNKQVDESKKQHEANQQRDKNYKAFLKQIEEEKLKNTTWAEFPNRNFKKNVVDNSERQVTEKKISGIKRKLDVVTKVAKRLKKSPGNEVPHEQTSAKKPKRDRVDKSESQAQVKFMKKKKTVKVVASKRRLNEADKKTAKKFKKSASTETDKQKNIVKQQKKPVDVASLPEAEQKKIAKKKEKRLRQLEKKVLNQQHAKKNGTKTKGDHPPQRRKYPQNSMIINGKEVEIAYVDGFPIKKEDASRIQLLRKQMISKGLPRSEIKTALKLERRKAEKAFAREKKKVCFNCRLSGHNLSECPELGKEMAESTGAGICFKCGSTEHTHFECKVVKGLEYKFAQCFICREQGHIARQCPDNARGLYPKGGACRVCGDVTHLKKDCPKYQSQQQQLQDAHLETIDGGNPDSLSNIEERPKVDKTDRTNKIVKF